MKSYEAAISHLRQVMERTYAVQMNELRSCLRVNTNGDYYFSVKRQNIENMANIHICQEEPQNLWAPLGMGGTPSGFPMGHHQLARQHHEWHCPLYSQPYGPFMTELHGQQTPTCVNCNKGHIFTPSATATQTRDENAPNLACFASGGDLNNVTHNQHTLGGPFRGSTSAFKTYLAGDVGNGSNHNIGEAASLAQGNSGDVCGNYNYNGQTLPPGGEGISSNNNSGVETNLLPGADGLDGSSNNHDEKNLPSGNEGISDNSNNCIETNVLPVSGDIDSSSNKYDEKNLLPGGEGSGDSGNNFNGQYLLPENEDANNSGNDNSEDNLILEDEDTRASGNNFDEKNLLLESRDTSNSSNNIGDEPLLFESNSSSDGNGDDGRISANDNTREAPALNQENNANYGGGDSNDNYNFGQKPLPSEKDDFCLRDDFNIGKALLLLDTSGDMEGGGVNGFGNYDIGKSPLLSRNVGDGGLIGDDYNMEDLSSQSGDNRNVNGGADCAGGNYNVGQAFLFAGDGNGGSGDCGVGGGVYYTGAEPLISKSNTNENDNKEAPSLLPYDYFDVDRYYDPFKTPEKVEPNDTQDSNIRQLKELDLEEQEILKSDATEIAVEKIKYESAIELQDLSEKQFRKLAAKRRQRLDKVRPKFLKNGPHKVYQSYEIDAISRHSILSFRMNDYKKTCYSGKDAPKINKRSFKSCEKKARKILTHPPIDEVVEYLVELANQPDAIIKNYSAQEALELITHARNQRKHKPSTKRRVVS
ncbi:putative uncharacterized protein DDB_G0282133 [Copidosoma floridanum]|uniref:putative uncharacterized protein DDB_G0282133 n=1 Tax=Copidosoma floridanum TaxID=29053 RepID=UPI0006C95D8D|nr:putative uncharacterized protein DDB_G0282133 [Copidosoma floridanum]XP_014210467.1 putative uncharacterized protein DDB_G0282133 [Copidosoma floridanum]